jgi:hypothetical protein
VVSGAVTAPNGWPVRGATVRAADNSAATLTDTNGLYSLTLAPGWTGSIFPTLPGAEFAPASRAYTGLATNLAGQDFSLETDLHPTLSISLVGTNARVSWLSLPPFKYQLKSAENFLLRQNVGAVTNGTGVAISRDVPLAPSQPSRQLRVQVIAN